MSDLLDRLRKAALNAQEQEGIGRYSASGKTITCTHCGNDRFDMGKVVLDTTLLTVDLDGADRKATALSCRSCGRIQWFSRAPRPQVRGSDPVSNE